MNQQERLQHAVNEIYSMLARDGLPSCCAVCGTACRTVRDLQFVDDAFVMAVPLKICARCAFPPLFTRSPICVPEGKPSSVAALLLSPLWAIADRFARAFNQKGAAAKDLKRPTLDALARTITAYGRLLEAFPQTTVTFAQTALRQAVWRAEAARFRASLIFSQCSFQLNIADEFKRSRLPTVLLASYPEIIEGRIEEVVALEPLKGPLIVQVGAVLLPGRRWEFECQLVTDAARGSLDPLKDRILQSLESLPTWPVEFPVVWMVKRAFGKPPASLHQKVQKPFKDWSLRVFAPNLSYAEAARRLFEVALPQLPLVFKPEDCAAILGCLPESLPLKMLHADVLTACGRQDDALAIWNALVEQFPDDWNIVGRRIGCLAQSQQVERAAAECQKYILGHPKEANPYATLSEMQFRLQLPAESLASIDQSLALRERAACFQARAAILAEMERFEDATSAVNAAIFQDRNYAPAWLLRAKLYLHAKRYAEAVDDLHQYHRCAGKSVHSLQLLSTALRALGRVAEAEGAYRIAIKELPHHLALKLDLAEFLVQTGRLESARQECDRILEGDPHFGIAYAIRSAADIEMNQYEEAIQDADRAAEHGALGPKTFLIRAAAKARLGRTDEALADFNLCVEMAPNYAFGRFHRGRLYKEREDYSAAIADFNAALEIAPDWADALVERGYALLGQGEHSEAHKDFARAIELVPSLSDAYAGRGIAALLEGKKQAALEDVNKAVLLDPNNLRGRMQRAILLLEQMDAESAKADLDQILAVRPDCEPALWQRAHLQLQLGKFVAAKEDFDRLIEIKPEQPQSFIGRSVARELAGDIARAEADREEARRLAPFSTEQLTLSQNLLVASVADANEEYEKVIEVTTKIIDEHPEPVWDAFRLRGRANWYAENFVEALEDYDHILGQAEELAGHDLIAYGQILGELGEYERGLESLDRAIALAREKEDFVGLAFSLNGRGRALAGLGRLEEAEEAFRESLKLRPDNAWLHFNRGLMYAEQQKLNQALACFELALCVESPKLAPGKRRRAAGFINKLRGGNEVEPSSTTG